MKRYTLCYWLLLAQIFFICQLHLISQSCCFSVLSDFCLLILSVVQKDMLKISTIFGFSYLSFEYYEFCFFVFSSSVQWVHTQDGLCFPISSVSRLRRESDTVGTKKLPGQNVHRDMIFPLSATRSPRSLLDVGHVCV